MLFCLAGFAQQTITGVVLEEATSEPLAGAAVQVKDSQSGTIADADGRFSISVSPGQTLLFSYIGMIPQEVVVKASMTEITIKMLSDAVDINEVVVVGSGVQKKVNLFRFFRKGGYAGTPSGCRCRTEPARYGAGFAG